MLDMSYQGKEFPPFTYKIEASKIRELCAAIGDDNPIYFDSNAAVKEGYKDTPAPLTYPTQVNFWGYPEIWDRMTEVGIDIKRLLHAKEEYEYFQPVYPGDTITGTVCVDSMRDSTMQMVTFKSTLSRDGETVCIAKMTIVVPPSEGGK
jgi:acyl dehydratase